MRDGIRCWPPTPCSPEARAMSTPPEQQHFFVRRPIVAMVIAIITVIVGVVSMLGLPIEQYPDITPPSCRCAPTTPA